MREKSLLTLLLRGAVGGALGGFCWLTISLLWETPAHRAYFVSAILHTVPLTAILGLVTGGMVWLAHLLSGKNLGNALRAIAGIFISIFIWGLFLWIRGEFESDTLKDARVYLAFFGAVVGTIAVLVAGSQVLGSPYDGNGSR